MAIFKPKVLSCSCGEPLEVLLADSVNAGRIPESREKILNGDFHRTSCEACGRQFTVEKPFHYTDLERNTFFLVRPRGERHQWKEASGQLDRAVAWVPESLSKHKDRNLRVVFGMDELREKLVAQDAGIDDRTVELLKVLIIYEHPFLIQKPRLRLVLADISDDSFDFIASYEHSPGQFRVSLPRWIVDELQDNQALQAWSDRQPEGGLYTLDDHWVNYWRWSPQPSALDKLQGYAKRLREGKKIDPDSQDFDTMLSGLPHGNHLPGWAKKDLRTLFVFARKNDLEQLQDRLFEIHFGIDLEDDWTANQDRDDVDTLWLLLKDLPDAHVEGNTFINELLLEEGEGGGWYSPTTHDIGIGSRELADKESFEDVMRHEVGHAVHEAQDSLIQPWLESEFGWKIFGRSDAEIDEWVQLMGGWGTLTTIERRQVRSYLRQALGGGSSWHPGTEPSVPNNHPWRSSGFAPRLCYEKTGSHWYENNKTWHRANGKAFFLNYWYRVFMAVDENTLKLVNKMPSTYAAMSHYEFFAELYALYYDLDDPKRNIIPTRIKDWFENNLGGPEINAPMPGLPRDKKDWETIVRPKK